MRVGSRCADRQPDAKYRPGSHQSASVDTIWGHAASVPALSVSASQISSNALTFVHNPDVARTQQRGACVNRPNLAELRRNRRSTAHHTTTVNAATLVVSWHAAMIHNTRPKSHAAASLHVCRFAVIAG